MYHQNLPTPKPSDHQAVFALNELIAATRSLAELLETATAQLHADLDLSLPERSVLIDLRRGGAQTVPTLARGREVSRQFIQTVVNGLLARKLVVHKPNPAHRRSQLIALTTAGTGLIRDVMHREGGVLQALAGELAASEIRQAMIVLRQVTSNLSKSVG